jgi:DNA-binding transcriptional LysR family regulator
MDMHVMNLRALDLNLLVVFDAVMQDRNVTRAGRRIGLSQPAMSHALGRLRYRLKNELFIRTREGMVPTPRAEQLAASLSRILVEMQQTLEPETFEPTTANRRFTIGINNYAAVVLAARVCKTAASAAPSVHLDFRPSGTMDVFARLDRDLDLAIGNFADVGERFTWRSLFKDSSVLVMRSGHPAARRILTAQTLASLAYLEISSSGESTTFLDELLSKHGLVRRIASSAPYLSARDIVEQSDLVTVLSRGMAAQFALDHRLLVRELPFATPVITCGMAWHRRLADQPAHRWLRDMIQSTAKSMATQRK